MLCTHAFPQYQNTDYNYVTQTTEIHLKKKKSVMSEPHVFVVP